MAKVSKTAKHQVRRAGRDVFKRKLTWAVKPGDLVEDKAGNVGLALQIQSSSCYMLSPLGYRWVKLSQLIKITHDV